MDNVGPVFAPGAQETPEHGQAEAHRVVAGNWHAGAKQFVVEAIRARLVFVVLTWPENCHVVPPFAQTFDEVTERHGDAIDFGRESFGDEGEFQWLVRQRAINGVIDIAKRGKVKSGAGP